MLRNFRIKLSNTEIERKLAYEYVYKYYTELHLVPKLPYESFKNSEYIYVYEDNCKQLRMTNCLYAKYIRNWITLNLNYSKLLSLSVYKSNFIEIDKRAINVTPRLWNIFFLKFGRKI